LVTFDFTAKPPHPVVPVLAKSYEVSEDAKMITFRLRKGVQFHHGYGEFTSEDVVFNLKRHQDKKVASRARAQLTDVERIEAPDKYTVKIYLKDSSAFSLVRNLAYQTAGFMLSKKAVLKLGDKIERMPIGTGPYYYDRWEPGVKVVHKKFDKYWGTPAKIDEIEFWVIPEEIVALGALEKGDLDLVALTQKGSYERANAIKGTSIVDAIGGARIYVYWTNHKMKPLDDLRVRRALAHALDLKEICKRIGPQVRHWPSPIAPLAFGATNEFWGYEYDVNKAKQLLAEAGYPNGFELRLIYIRGALYEPIVLEVQSYWNKIVDVKLELIERSVYYKTLKQFKHHVAAWGTARYAPFLFAQYYLPGAPRNYSQYSNPKVTEVIHKAKNATTEEESRKYWREFQRMTTKDVASLWVANGKSLVVVNNKLKGVVVMPTPGIYILENAYIE
jgi:peptide/nickel transport system substrate-binding protein